MAMRMKRRPLLLQVLSLGDLIRSNHMDPTWLRRVLTIQGNENELTAVEIRIFP